MTGVPYARYAPSVDRDQCPSACLHQSEKPKNHAPSLAQSRRHRPSGTATPGTTLATPFQLGRDRIRCALDGHRSGDS